MSEPVRRSHRLKSGALSFLDWGGRARRTLLFSHANGFNARTYTKLLTPLAGDFRVFACDLRGHGRTTLPQSRGLAQDWSVFAEDLVVFLAGLGDGPVVLAGHSLGATASLFAAARAPDLVAALVLAEPVLLPPAQEDARGANNSLAQMAAQRRSTFASFADAFGYYRGRGIFARWPEEIVADYLAGGLAEAADGSFRLACTPEWESEIFRDAPLGIAHIAAGLACPLAILRGGIASTATADEVAEIRRLKPETRVVTIEGASHFLPIEEPACVRDEIRRFALCAPAG
ncbi:MAG: alpha/beta fold hydrolase [Rhizomicrobium sp.]